MQLASLALIFLTVSASYFVVTLTRIEVGNALRSLPVTVGRTPTLETPPPHALSAADPALETFVITIPGGWRIEQIADEYARRGGAGGAEAFLDAVATVDRSQFDFLVDVPADRSLEGYLFPDTYQFSSQDPETNVAAMLTNFGERVTPDMRLRAQQMGLTMDQVVTIASIVERETPLPEERPTIADIYLSRWEEGWRLDADPTVQYVLGTRENWWPALSGNDLFVASPFNTYQHEGLPPGPIANPSRSSITAVLFPDVSPYLFLVVKDETGAHAFAVTAAEQSANVERYWPQAAVAGTPFP